MKIQTSRFGTVEVSEERVYRFPEGLVGFPTVQDYCVLDHTRKGPFQWLHAVHESALAFVICDPRVFLPEYSVRVTREDLASIKLDDVARGLVMVILTVPHDPKKITANLLGPLVFNSKERLGKQLILSEAGYSTKHLIFSEAG